MRLYLTVCAAFMLAPGASAQDAAEVKHVIHRFEAPSGGAPQTVLFDTATRGFAIHGADGNKLFDIENTVAERGDPTYGEMFPSFAASSGAQISGLASTFSEYYIVLRTSQPGPNGVIMVGSQSFKPKHYFSASDGRYPHAGPVDNTGSLYGVSETGGAGNAGTIWKFSPPASGQPNYTLAVLYNFTGGLDGMNPRATPLLGNDGALYGTTSNGGRYGYGAVFRLGPPPGGAGDWTESIIHSFSSADGAMPLASLIQDSSGVLYGTAEDGGKYNGGVAFSMTPPANGGMNWSYSVLHDFGSGSDGKHPVAALARGADGALYGATSSGGSASNNGSIFRLSLLAGSWKEDILNRFVNASGGTHPISSLMIVGSNLFGTTQNEGLKGGGTVFYIPNVVQTGVGDCPRC